MSLPEPLTPIECDLQDFPFMPLHVARLRDSDLAAEESPEACWYAVLLWAASWHQLPAASLPDNDAVLTKLIGLGRDVKTFRKHKAASLRGFVKCSDGRLYHPMVAEQALTAWRSKLQQRWRTECARIKKANQRNGTDEPMPTFEEFLSSECPPSSPDYVPGDKGECPQGQRLQETGTGTGIEEEDADASLSPEGDEAKYPEAFEACWQAYPHVRGRSSKKKTYGYWRRVSVGRRDLLPSAIARYAREGREPHDECGAPAMERWLRDERYLDWLTAGPAKDPPPGLDWKGPPDLLSDLRRLMGDGHADEALRRSCWDEARRAIVTSSPTIASMIRRDAESALRKHHTQIIEEKAA